MKLRKISIIGIVLFISVNSCGIIKERKKQKALRDFNKYFAFDSMISKSQLKGFDTIFYHDIVKNIDTFIIDVNNVKSETILNLHDSTLIQRLTVRDTFTTHQLIIKEKEPYNKLDTVFKIVVALLVLFMLILFIKIFWK